MNSFRRHKALADFSNLRGGEKRGCEVLLGDQEFAADCKFLVRNKIQHNQPSKNCITLEPVPFAHGGCHFDLRAGTVNGVPVYIFEMTADLWKFARRLTATRSIKEDAAQHQSGDLRALYELFPGRATWPWTLTDDFLRCEIAECLGVIGLDFGLKELEDLAKVAQREPL